jgi:glycosyltransferase involved in cell wall biosynthesis
MPNPMPLDFCLLIPCYNNLEGLIQSLNSIAYEADKYQVVIVDDGSTIPITIETIQPLLTKPLPLHIISYRPNKGITHALNTGLDWILQYTDAAYIARLDCSDICHEQRFYQQVQYLDQHPEVGLLGSWCRFQSADSKLQYSYQTPTQYAQIKKAMYLRNVFIHPTVMFRTKLIDITGPYPYDYSYAEDYAFFWKLLQQAEGVILNQYLVTCALNSAGISLANRKAQLHSRQKVVNDFGTSHILKTVGILKLKLMRYIPYKLILKLKNS